MRTKREVVARVGDTPWAKARREAAARDGDAPWRSETIQTESSRTVVAREGDTPCKKEAVARDGDAPDTNRTESKKEAVAREGDAPWNRAATKEEDGASWIETISSWKKRYDRGSETSKSDCVLASCTMIKKKHSARS